jgi:hypothetical protein
VHVPVLLIIPATVAQVNATDEGYLLVHCHKLFMMRPHQDAFAWYVIGMTQNLHIKIYN